MRDILFTLISIFVAGNVLTEWRNRKTLPWMRNPMSAYLAHVPWALAQDIGFLALVGACPVVRISLGGASFGAGQLPDGYFIYTHNTLKP